MQRRVIRSLTALLVGLALSLLIAEPATAGYVAGPEQAFTGHLYSPTRNLHYCGVAHSQIGDTNSQASGWAFTRPALFFILCNSATSTTVPRGWLATQAVMLRNGSVCSDTNYLPNDGEAYILGVRTIPCANPPGWQEWMTVGGHRIVNESNLQAPGGTTFSPWALY
jgi:hypothetical protein